MRALSPSEKRTLRVGAALIAIYLAGFYGLKGFAFLESKLAEYRDVSLLAGELNVQVLREKAKAQRFEKLSSKWRIDLPAIQRKTLVGEALASIQNAAQSNGVVLGPLKELPGRSSARELALLQLEGTGPTLAVAQFLRSLSSQGYPLAVDSLQLKTPGPEPGQVGFSLGVAVLDFGEWKKEEKSGA